MERVVARRVYEDVRPDDGARVLVDRVWPRGLRKEDAHLDEWCRDVAPSTELRRWFAHDPAKFSEFVRRYHGELDDSPRMEAVDWLRRTAKDRPLTLLTATKDLEHSHARVLADLLSARALP